jgi:diamine N-acetyltransferase
MRPESERLRLRLIDEADIEWLRETRNKNRNNFFSAEEITKEQQKAWYERYRESNIDNMFIIQLKDGRSVGTIALYNIDMGTRSAELGRVLILDEFRGHGYAEEAVRVLAECAFNLFRLYRIRVQTHMDNLDAIAVYARAGFKTTTRPIILLEKINPNYDPKKPLVLESYDDMSPDGHESTASNVRGE